MSCIKFPSSKSELTKTSHKDYDYAAINLQLIATANQVFGQGNWSHAVNQTLDYVDYVSGKYQAGCASIVRVQLKNDTFHEGMGYSSNEGSSKGSAIQRVRLASLNDALRNALICFGNDVINKINKSSNRPMSPLPIEFSVNKVSKVETPTSESTVTKKDEAEAFAENIPMSQTDALMDIVDLDQLFDKDEKVNDVKISKNDPKTDVIKATVVADKKPLTSQNLNSQTEIKASTSTGQKNLTEKNKTNISNASNVPNNLKKEIKSGVPTVMTEEEMRLERKRKQREMQEEFRRKEEIKRKHSENGNKQLPNPRY